MEPQVRARSVLAASKWQKEMLRTIAVSCLNKISQGPTLTVNDLKKRIGILFHVDSHVDGSLGYANHFSKGRSQFEDLWTKEDLVVNAAGNDERQVAHDLVLKDGYSRDFASHLLAGKQFTAQSVKSANQKGNSLIVGRTLLNCAKLVLKTGKKHLPLVLPS